MTPGILSVYSYTIGADKQFLAASGVPQCEQLRLWSIYPGQSTQEIPPTMSYELIGTISFYPYPAIIHPDPARGLIQGKSDGLGKQRIIDHAP